MTDIPSSAAKRSGPGFLQVTGVAAVFVALLPVFGSVMDFLQSDREVTLQRMQEDRARVGEFITSVAERRSMAVNLNASLKRGFDNFEITHRKLAYEDIYRDSPDILYRMQNLVRTSIAPPRSTSAALRETWDMAPGAFVDARYGRLLSYLSAQDNLLQDRYECWVLARRGSAGAPEESAAAGTRHLSAEQASAALAAENCTRFGEPTAAAMIDLQFGAVSRAARLCMNQLAVEVYKLRSSRREQALVVFWRTLSRRQEDWARIFENLDTYCPTAPETTTRPTDATQATAWEASWAAFNTRVRELESGLTTDTGAPRTRR